RRSSDRAAPPSRRAVRPGRNVMSLPCHPILYRMRLDHPDDHPDDPSGSVWIRLDRRGIQREQARSVWSRPGRRGALARNRRVVGSNPTFVLDETLFRCSLMLITTTPGIEGRTVTEYLGIVTAQGVLGVNAFKDVGAGMRNIFGGRSKSYENELASGVSDALAEMEQQAAHLGADAVIGVDIDYETVGSNMLMVSASGTAVKLS